MKFTSEDLLKAMGLTVGDKVIINGKTHTFTTKKDGTLICKNVLKQLIDQDYEILPKPKRVGDLKCEECICAECPLKYIRCENYFYDEVILYDILEGVNGDYKDQELYNLLKSRLDKVIEE